MSQDQQQQPPIDPDDLDFVITELSDSDRRIDIEVPERSVKRFFKKLKKSGQKLDDNQIQVLLSRFCIKAGVQRLGRKPLFGPVPATDEKPVLKVGQPYRMSILCDVAPELDIPDFKTISIKRPVKKITEEMIESELLQQKLDAGRRIEYEGPLAISDEYEGSFSLLDPTSDEQLLGIDSIHLRILAPGSPVQIGGLFFNDLSAAMVGHVVGDTVTVESTIPAGFPDPELVDKPVNMQVEVKQAWRIEPAGIEEVLAQYGTPNEIIFRQQIALSLEQRAENDQLTAMSVQLFDALVSMIEIPIPERILNHHYQLLRENQAQQLKAAGISPEEIDATLDSADAKLQEKARVMLSMNVIISELCREMEIKVDEQEVQDQIAVIAASQGRRPEDFRKELLDSDMINSIFQEVLKNKLAQRLFTQVQIVDVDADEWNRTRS